jgi:hypothetical protein
MQSRLLAICTVDQIANGSNADEGAIEMNPSAESRPQAAAHQRAAPTARRFGLAMREALIFRGFCQHKAL